MSTTLHKTSSIHIVGAGTFGLSTALDLARRGYTNITCFDKYSVPSEIAAGNDSNKIFDYNYVAPDENASVSDRLAFEAKELWENDPVFKDHFHRVGFIFASSSEEPIKDTNERCKYLNDKKLRSYEFLNSPADFKKHLPVLTGDLPNWRGVVLENDMGWLHARNSLISAFGECKKLGVKFVFGDEGEIIDVETSEDKVTALVSKSGNKYSADKYVVCAGANAVTILDFKQQIQSKCFTLAHVKVTDEEAEKFKGLPVLFNVEKGFFFEADENNEIKICNEFPGYTNVNKDGESIPLYKMEIPVDAEKEIRQFLKETMPFLANRPFVKTRCCWCTDSPDRELIVTSHPELKNLVIGSGDSGKSFMLMPVIGKYISKVITNGDQSLKDDERTSWRWRPETSVTRDNKQDRWGGKGIVVDLSELNEWVSVENPTPHNL